MADQERFGSRADARHGPALATRPATRSEPVVFITKDSDFLDPATRARLHPDLIEDLVAAGLPGDRIRPVESLKEAVEQVVRPARELLDSLRARLSSDAAWRERLVARLEELAAEDADAVGFEVDVGLDMSVERYVEEIDIAELDYLDHFGKVAIADILPLGLDGFGVEVWLSATAFYEVSVILSDRVWDAPSEVRAAIDDGFGLSEQSASVGGIAQVLLIFEATYDPESGELANISLRRMSDDQGEPTLSSCAGLTAACAVRSSESDPATLAGPSSITPVDRDRSTTTSANSEQHRGVSRLASPFRERGTLPPRRLGSRVGPWPGARPDALVERVGGEVGPAGPDDGASLPVDFDFGEALRSASVLENGAAHAIEHVYLSAQPIGEGQPKDAVADDLCGGDIRG